MTFHGIGGVITVYGKATHANETEKHKVNFYERRGNIRSAQSAFHFQS